MEISIHEEKRSENEKNEQMFSITSFTEWDGSQTVTLQI